MNLIRILSFAIFFSLNANAVPIAVVDSGTDFDHPDLKGSAWLNPRDQKIDGKDDEHNGMKDDVHGWNFADRNNKLIAKELMGTFSPDVYKYFDLQLKKFQGTISEEEIKWMKSKVGYKPKKGEPETAMVYPDLNFIDEMGVFGNFMHGTHVSAIVAKDAPHNEIMGIKLLPTTKRRPRDPKELKEWAKKNQFPVDDAVGKVKEGASDKIVDALIKMGLYKLAGAQSEMLVPVGRYLRLSGIKVANCSFGTSPHAIKPLLAQLLGSILGNRLTNKKMDEFMTYFMTSLAEQGRRFSVIANKTLFVMAAGNDGANTDTIPAYPAGLERHNVITVAATFGVTELAEFSNYGKTSVDVAAPGVGILSAQPGTGFVRVSGTSQAAPFVTNVAGRMLDQNPALSPAEVKALLMQTVDVKPSLMGKVASNGVVNADRAILAAQLSRGMSISEAVTLAKTQVADVVETLTMPVKKPAARATAFTHEVFAMPQAIFF